MARRSERVWPWVVLLVVLLAVYLATMEPKAPATKIIPLGGASASKVEAVSENVTERFGGGTCALGNATLAATRPPQTGRSGGDAGRVGAAELLTCPVPIGWPMAGPVGMAAHPWAPTLDEFVARLWVHPRPNTSDVWRALQARGERAARQAAAQAAAQAASQTSANGTQPSSTALQQPSLVCAAHLVLLPLAQSLMWDAQPPSAPAGPAQQPAFSQLAAAAAAGVCPVLESAVAATLLQHCSCPTVAGTCASPVDSTMEPHVWTLASVLLAACLCAAARAVMVLWVAAHLETAKTEAPPLAPDEENVWVFKYGQRARGMVGQRLPCDFAASRPVSLQRFNLSTISSAGLAAELAAAEAESAPRSIALQTGRRPTAFEQRVDELWASRLGRAPQRAGQRFARAPPRFTRVASPRARAGGAPAARGLRSLLLSGPLDDGFGGDAAQPQQASLVTVAPDSAQPVSVLPVSLGGTATCEPTRALGAPAAAGQSAGSAVAVAGSPAGIFVGAEMLQVFVVWQVLDDTVLGVPDLGSAVEAAAAELAVATAAAATNAAGESGGADVRVIGTSVLMRQRPVVWPPGIDVAITPAVLLHAGVMARPLYLWPRGQGSAGSSGAGGQASDDMAASSSSSSDLTATAAAPAQSGGSEVAAAGPSGSPVGSFSGGSAPLRRPMVARPASLETRGQESAASGLNAESRLHAWRSGGLGARSQARDEAAASVPSSVLEAAAEAAAWSAGPSGGSVVALAGPSASPVSAFGAASALRRGPVPVAAWPLSLGTHGVLSTGSGGLGAWRQARDGAATGVPSSVLDARGGEAEQGLRAIGAVAESGGSSGDGPDGVEDDGTHAGTPAGSRRIFGYVVVAAVAACSCLFIVKAARRRHA